MAAATRPGKGADRSALSQEENERLEGIDDRADERRNLTRLTRWVAAFIAWPSLTIGLAFLVFTDPGEHWLHIAGLLPLGLAAVVVFAMAPRLAERWAR